MAPFQKYPDLCGPTAWAGGVAAVEAASPNARLYQYVRLRLQVIAKITSQNDPTKLMNMNFEAMLVAIEQLSPLKP